MSYLQEDHNKLINFFVYGNAALITADTVTQIIHYAISTWATENLKNASLLFILIRPILHFFLFLIYFSFHWEKILDIGKKFITFLVHMISVYIGYSPFVHCSFYSKYYLESENGIIISRVVNIYAFALVSIPKLIIIPINSSLLNKWKAIDIIAVSISCLYISFCIVYYFMCLKYDYEFEVNLEESASYWKLTSTNYETSEGKVLEIQPDNPFKDNEINDKKDNKEERKTIEVDLKEKNNQGKDDTGLSHNKNNNNNNNNIDQNSDKTDIKDKKNDVDKGEIQLKEINVDV